MTAAADTDRDRGSELSLRLAVVPALAGLVSLGAYIVGASAAGLTAGGASALVVWVGAAFVGAAMLTGFVANHYLGLVLLAVAALVVGDGATDHLILLIVGAAVCHEVGRFSLDARLPNRLGPGVGLGIARRALIPIGVGLLVALVAPTLSSLAPPAAVVPLGLMAATAPLFLLRIMAALPSGVDADPRLRAALGLGVAVLAVGGALAAGAGAGEVRDRIEARPAATDAPSSAGSTTTGGDDAPTDDGGEETGGVGVLAVVLLVVAALAVISLLVVALRRPEVSYELDELQIDDDATTFSLAGGGRAMVDDQEALFDERSYAALLDDLRLDLATEDDPGRSIRFAYVTIEQRLAARGIQRARTETEQELLARALPTLPDDGPALRELTALFEAARFSPVPASESMRRQALEAVATLRSSLAERTRDGGLATDGDGGAERHGTEQHGTEQHGDEGAAGSIR
ncbi:MAG: DUF4129 domain-containing protein [Actinomycetota bacterium]